MSVHEYWDLRMYLLKKDHRDLLLEFCFSQSICFRYISWAKCNVAITNSVLNKKIQRKNTTIRSRATWNLGSKYFVNWCNLDLHCFFLQVSDVAHWPFFMTRRELIYNPNKWYLTTIFWFKHWLIIFFMFTTNDRDQI